MKCIKYQIMTEVNHGTEEKPIIVQSLNDCEIWCGDSNFESNYTAAQRKAYGKVTVEDDGQPEPPPTTEQRVSDLEEQLVQADETAIALYESQQEQETINAQQDEALMEIYEMLG